MNTYLKNLISRANEHSKTLDKKEIFIDHPWVLLDEKGNKETYIFKRNGELIMSLNGSVTIGSWELLLKASSILIDRVKDKILLQHEFIDEALMVLKVDDISTSPFILVNSNIIKDLNIEKYLNNLTQEKKVSTLNSHSKNNVKEIELDDGRVLRVMLNNYADNYLKGFTVTIDNLIVNDCIVEDVDGFLYKITNNEVYEVYEPKEIELTNQHAIIYTPFYSGKTIGSLIFIDNKLATTGSYIDTTTQDKYVVTDGLVVDHSNNSNKIIAALVAFLGLLFILALLVYLKK